MHLMEATNGIVAAPGVEGDQDVAGGPVIGLAQGDFMLQLAQDAQPPDSCDFVAVV